MSRIYDWFRDRFDLDAVAAFAKKKEVPLYRGTFLYYLGGICLFLFGLQVLTGILLLLYYQPGENTAYESMKTIISRVEFGWLIRDIHGWSANLLIFFAFLHMFSVFFGRAYRKPRELTWMTGFILLALAMGFGFTGYLLPWNELAYFATRVGTNIPGSVPVVGGALLKLLRAGDEVTGATLTRFYGIHVSVLPALFAGVLGLHLLLIQVLGMSVPPSQERLPPEERRSIRFFPNFFLRDVMVWLVILNVIAVLAVFFPWELGAKADPLAPAPAGIRPEWYFMFTFQTLKLLPAHILGVEGEVLGILGFGLGGLIWFCIPFIDRWEGSHKVSRAINVFGVVVVVYMIVMTIWGYLA